MFVGTQHTTEQMELNTRKRKSQDTTKITSDASLGTMSSSAPSGVRRVNRWTQNAEQRRENSHVEPLAFSRHDINLEFDEENVKPERLTKAPGHAGH